MVFKLYILLLLLLLVVVVVVVVYVQHTNIWSSKKIHK